MATLFYPLRYSPEKEEGEDETELFNSSQILRIETERYSDNNNDEKTHLCIKVRYNEGEKFMYFLGDVDALKKAAIEL